MDIRHIFQGELFLWDAKKAESNLKKHGVSFEEACEVFFDPFYHMDDAGRQGEGRWALIGYSEAGRLLYVVTMEKADEGWRIIPARLATKQERYRYEKNEIH